MENKISIIIPAYNLADHIGNTLDSVLSQTYTNLEIIVVNDGSNDFTSSIIDTYASKHCRIKAIHKENGGVTSARLRGIAEATGDWIGFVDGDDFIEPSMYERLMENALKYSADISHCGYQMVFPNRVDYYYNTGKIIQQDNATALVDLLEGKFIEPCLCNKLFRRSLFDKLPQYMDISIKNTEDLLMNYYLFKSSSLSIYEDICPYHYILRKSSAATAQLNEHKLWDPMRVTQIILSDIPSTLKPIIYRKWVQQLVRGATIDYTSQPELILPYQTQARHNLKKNLSKIVADNNCGLKLKLMALWTAVWPASYRWIHKVYEKITGLDKKYDLSN